MQQVADKVHPFPSAGPLLPDHRVSSQLAQMYVLAMFRAHVHKGQGRPALAAGLALCQTLHLQPTVHVRFDPSMQVHVCFDLQ